jgi:hypothetical protein
MIQEDELIVELANGFSLRSGSVEFYAGDYVRLCAPDGEELIYWDSSEWAITPVVVMGAILAAAVNAPTIAGMMS